MPKLKSADAGKCHGGGNFPQFRMAIQQLLRSFHIVASLGRAHVRVVKAVQVMARIKNDERIINVMCHAGRLANFHGVTEMHGQLHQTRQFAFDVVRRVQHDHQLIDATAQQEPA